MTSFIESSRDEHRNLILEQQGQREGELQGWEEGSLIFLDFHAGYAAPCTQFVRQ